VLTANSLQDDDQLLVTITSSNSNLCFVFILVSVSMVLMPAMTTHTSSLAPAPAPAPLPSWWRVHVSKRLIPFWAPLSFIDNVSSLFVNHLISFPASTPMAARPMNNLQTAFRTRRAHMNDLYVSLNPWSTWPSLARRLDKDRSRLRRWNRNYMWWRDRWELRMGVGLSSNPNSD
jgi:hypothetical protein